MAGSRRELIDAYGAVFRLEEQGHAPCNTADVPGTQEYDNAVAALEHARAATPWWRRAGAFPQAIHEHRGLLSSWGMSRADSAAWADTHSMRDLGERTVQWLDGQIIQTPGHGGPPDPETAEIADDLRMFNRNGYVTTNSEINYPSHRVGANVMGYADRATAERIEKAAKDAGLECDVNRSLGRAPSRWDRMRGRTQQDVDRARRDGPPALLDDCWMTAPVGDGAWDELEHSVLVEVRDPNPKRGRHLWDTLTAALAPEPSREDPPLYTGYDRVREEEARDAESAWGRAEDARLPSLREDEAER